MKSVVLLVYWFFSLIVVAQNDRTTANNGAPFYSNGYHTIYNEQALLWQEGLFINGTLSTGRIVHYNSLSEIERIDYYQNGLKTSLSSVYTNPQPEDSTPKGKWLFYGKTNPSPPTKKTCTPTAGMINNIDEHCKRQGHWIYYGKDRPESGIPAEGKIEEGNYVDDRKEGIWTKYHNDGKTPKIVVKYTNNRPNGSYCKYDKNGKLIEKGTLTKHLFKDSLIRGYQNGQIEYEAWYNEYGKEDGVVNYYYPNGQLEFTSTAKNGVPIDTAKRFYENGDLKEWVLYDKEGSVILTKQFALNSQLIPTQNNTASPHAPSVTEPVKTIGNPWNPNKYNKVLNENGEVWQDGIFKDGQLWNGKVYVFDKDGILLKVEIYKSGVYHSDGQLY